MIPLAPGLLFFVPAVLVGNLFGALLRYPDIGAAVLFPPYAILTAALVATARRDWIWYILVGSVAHFTTHWPQWSVTWVLLADAANIARALTAALLLQWAFGGPPRLDSVRGLALFVFSAVLAAPAVGATLGAFDVLLHGAATNFWSPWSGWFLSNALTGLTLLPALALTITGIPSLWSQRVKRRRILEGIILTAALAVTCAVALLWRGRHPWHIALPLYSPLPVLIWAALRFGPAGASVALSVVAFGAIWAADRGTGPFTATATDANILLLQVFLLLTTLPVLCIAAVNSGRHKVVQLYHALLASLNDHVAILDARGIVLEVNGSWRRFAENAKVDLFHRVGVGDDYLEACRAAVDQGDDTAARAFAGVQRILRRESRRFEMEYDQEQDGKRERYALSLEALARPDGGVVVTRANVTARRQAMMQIEEQRRELSHLARVAVLGQLSGALAHELNQPLTAISSNAEAARRLLRRQPADLQEVDEILGDIASEDQRAAQVIRRLRALLKRGDTHLQPMDIRELVSEVLELAHAELITRRVTATALVAPDLPSVLGDRVQLQQVLLNLIINACEAMTSTAAADRRLTLIANVDARNNVHVSVQDCGTGIPAALLERLFEPFVTTKSEGLGLGLSISRTIVAAHGGRLWAENNTDRGATVHCLLVSSPDAALEPPGPGSTHLPSFRH
ncbi:MAG TPA: MASE1 domain-containing protein [Gemmatimonadales bacterium]|nr:MASE1 domain-containing protein [Gemmatimonadales bacterium]